MMNKVFKADLEREPSSLGQSSVDLVYDQILLRIICGDFKSGETLVCTRLADELNVSRTPVVSAVDRLVRDGILIKKKNHRALVKESADTWLLQIHQLREIVEPPAAGLAAKFITEEAIRELGRLAELSLPESCENWLQLAREFDFALHRSIADHCGNLAIRETIHKCWKYKRISYQLGCSNLELEEIGHREHLAILSALSQHDSDTASAAMLYHLRSSFCFTKNQQVV